MSNIEQVPRDLCSFGRLPLAGHRRCCDIYSKRTRKRNNCGTPRGRKAHIVRKVRWVPLSVFTGPLIRPTCKASVPSQDSCITPPPAEFGAVAPLRPAAAIGALRRELAKVLCGEALPDDLQLLQGRLVGGFIRLDTGLRLLHVLTRRWESVSTRWALLRTPGARVTSWSNGGRNPNDLSQAG